MSQGVEHDPGEVHAFTEHPEKRGHEGTAGHDVQHLAGHLHTRQWMMTDIIGNDVGVCEIDRYCTGPLIW